MNENPVNLRRRPGSGDLEMYNNMNERENTKPGENDIIDTVI